MAKPIRDRLNEVRQRLGLVDVSAPGVRDLAEAVEVVVDCVARLDAELETLSVVERHPDGMVTKRAR